MKRIDLIPTVTTDGRHIILQAVPVPPRERARRLLDKLRLGKGGEGRRRPER